MTVYKIRKLNLYKCYIANFEEYNSLCSKHLLFNCTKVPKSSIRKIMLVLLIHIWRHWFLCKICLGVLLQKIITNSMINKRSISYLACFVLHPGPPFHKDTPYHINRIDNVHLVFKKLKHYAVLIKNDQCRKGYNALIIQFRKHCSAFAKMRPFKFYTIFIWIYLKNNNINYTINNLNESYIFYTILIKC